MVNLGTSVSPNGTNRCCSLSFFSASHRRQHKADAHILWPTTISRRTNCTRSPTRASPYDRLSRPRDHGRVLNCGELSREALWRLFLPLQYRDPGNSGGVQAFTEFSSGLKVHDKSRAPNPSNAEQRSALSPVFLKPSKMSSDACYAAQVGRPRNTPQGVLCSLCTSL